MVESYLQWAVTTGVSFVPAWSNASVVIVALVIFVVGFLAAAFSGRQWLFDVAFLALVAGGILVPWPAMVALSIAAVILATLLSFLHRALAPARSARIEAEAARIASARTRDFVRDLGHSGSLPEQIPEDVVRRSHGERGGGEVDERECRRTDGKA